MTQPANLVCLIGFDYEPKGRKPRRFEIGDPVTKLPDSIVEQLVEQGVIEAAPEGDA